MLPPLPPESHRLQPSHHPTPFSADQIREACAPGRRSVYRIDTRGEDPYLLVWWFVGGDSERADMVNQRTDLVGTPLGPEGPGQATWGGLQAHASYPAATTEVTVGAVDVGAGRFDAWCYQTDDGGTVTRSWFAAAVPGPPVLIITTEGGTESYRFELLEWSDPRVVPRG